MHIIIRIQYNQLFKVVKQMMENTIAQRCMPLQSHSIHWLGTEPLVIIL